MFEQIVTNYPGVSIVGFEQLHEGQVRDLTGNI